MTSRESSNLVNIRIVPDPTNPADESLQLIREEQAKTNNFASNVALLDQEKALVDKERQELYQRSLRFERQAGSNLSTAFQLGLLPLLSWIIDLVVLSPIIEVIADWVGFWGQNSVIPQIFASFVWMAFGYTLGAELALIKKPGRSSWLAWSICIIYILALPTIAYSIASRTTELQGLPSVGIALMAIFGSILPVFSGAVSADARDYLLFLWRRGRLEAKLRDLELQRHRAGYQVVEQFEKLLTKIELHERQFGERIQPQLTDLARRIIEEYSRGRYHVQFHEQEPPEPRPASSNGIPRTTPHEGPSDQNREDLESELDYLRRIISHGADEADREIAPVQNDIFTVRLP